MKKKYDTFQMLWKVCFDAKSYQKNFWEDSFEGIRSLKILKQNETWGSHVSANRRQNRFSPNQFVVVENDLGDVTTCLSTQSYC